MRERLVLVVVVALELPLGRGEILEDEVETVKEREEVPLRRLSRTLLSSHA